MKPTLCVVLPVSNVETTLATDVKRLLDAASQIESAFEVLILDNGSRDDTFDIACDLATEFSQVRIVTLRITTGLGRLVEMARTRTEAEWLCIHQGVGRICADDVYWLWRAHLAGEAVSRMQESPPQLSRVDTRWFHDWAESQALSARRSVRSPMFHLIRREVAGETAEGSTGESQFASQMAVIERKGRATHSLQSRRRMIRAAASLSLAK